MNSEAKELLNIFHIDMNYRQLDMDFLRGFLKRIADMGFNAILWELENKVQWETCPECVWPEAMSKDEFRDLLKYAESLGLEPIPFLQTIGHAEYVLRHDKYIPFRENPEQYSCYCTSNPDVKAFLIKWIEEFLDLFGDIRYFLLGGDEAYVFGTCENCSKVVSQYGKNKLYNDHITAIAAPLLKRNVRPGIFNDWILRNPEDLDLISKDFVVWNWNYWDTDKTPEVVITRTHGNLKRDELPDDLLELTPEILDDENKMRSFHEAIILKNNGFDIILCSAASAAGDNLYLPEYLHAGNIVGAAAAVKKEGFLGNCVTSWSIRMHELVTQIPYIGLALPALNDPEKDSDTQYYEYCEKLFGTAPDKFVKASKLVSIAIPFGKDCSTGVQWDGMKGSVPAPKGHVVKYLENYKDDREIMDMFYSKIKKALCDIPEAIKLLTEFFQEAKSGYDIIECWLTAAEIYLNRIAISQKIMNNEKSADIAQFLKYQKEEYITYLKRYETPLSAEKNAGLVFDVIIDFFD